MRDPQLLCGCGFLGRSAGLAKKDKKNSMKPPRRYTASSSRGQGSLSSRRLCDTQPVIPAHLARDSGKHLHGGAALEMQREKILSGESAIIRRGGGA